MAFVVDKLPVLLRCLLGFWIKAIDFCGLVISCTDWDEIVVSQEDRREGGGGVYAHPGTVPGWTEYLWIPDNAIVWHDQGQ